jgi:general secretion pathway protein C
LAFTFRLSATQLVQSAALIAALAGGLFWSALLLTPAESHVPAVAPQVLPTRVDTAALQWFSNQPAPLDIKVSGVLAGARDSH